MSRAVASDKRRVTDCQCRSMNENATTLSSRTIGAIIMISARAYSPLGIASARKAERRWKASRNAGPFSRSERLRVPRCAASSAFSYAAATCACTLALQPPGQCLVNVENVALATDGLQIDRVRRIGFDLAAQTIDLHVDGAFAAGRIVARQLVPGDRRAEAAGEQAQEIALTLRELDRLLTALELATPDMESVVAHADFL